MRVEGRPTWERMNLYSSWHKRIDGRLDRVSVIDPRLLFL